ncbi:hypothetical protein Taro_026794 [Colocasia esculenta]|uniref:Uncharacterized protein n=1 Tax=Colocasia esculenta TaxID=4460 RepID=A0A843VI60_COLES|nr:hypothetical protein [Colocasia esculenta]
MGKRTPGILSHTTASRIAESGRDLSLVNSADSSLKRLSRMMWLGYVGGGVAVTCGCGEERDINWGGWLEVEQGWEYRFRCRDRPSLKSKPFQFRFRPSQSVFRGQFRRVPVGPHQASLPWPLSGHCRGKESASVLWLWKRDHIR